MVACLGEAEEGADKSAASTVSELSAEGEWSDFSETMPAMEWEGAEDKTTDECCAASETTEAV